MAQKRTIDIDINTNADEAAKQFETLSTGVKKAADSAENLDAKFEDVFKGVEPLTTRLGEAEDRLYELALAGDTTSKEYQELLTKVGEYRKVQIQTDLAVDGAAQTMSQKLGSALTGATSGFAATQGAMALFGSENEALEKTLVKVQAALAIQQGVQGLGVVYKELGGATGIATKAQAALNFVMNLNPFLLIATAIAAAIAALAKFTSVLDPAIDKLKQFSDFIGLTDFEAEELAKNEKKRAEEEKKRIQETIKRNKALDAERRRSFIAEKKRIELMRRLKQEEFDLNIALLESEGKNTIRLRKQRAKELLDEAKENEEIQRRGGVMNFGLFKKAQQERIKAQIVFNNILREQREANASKEKEEEKIEFDGKIERLQIQAATEVDIDKEKNEQIAKNAEEARERQKALDAKAREDAKKLAQYRIDVATQSLTAISDIAELFSKGSEKQAKRAFNVQKAVGIAQATINTAQAITKVFAETTDFTPTQSLRIANAVAIGVAGAAQVASIASQTFEGGSTGDTPSVNISGEAQAPSFNVVGDSGINQLAQLQQAPVQAFVVSGEVTTSQALDRNRVENATL